MARQTFCCTSNVLVLPVCGIFVSLLGLVLLIIYLVARGITSSLYLVEAPIPSYVAALMTIILGTISVLLVKKRHLVLICASIILSVLDLIVCIVHAVTAGLVSIPFLGSFSVCVLRATSGECQCYVLGGAGTNSTVIVPGDDTKHYTFKDVKSCGSIETTLKDFVYTLCIVYSFCALGCIVTAFLSTLLLCSSRRAQKNEADNERNQTRASSRSQYIVEEGEAQERNTATRDSVERATSPFSFLGNRSGRGSIQTTPQGVQPTGGSTRRERSRTPSRRPVQRSASVNTPTGAVTSSSRSTSRHQSVTTVSGGASRSESSQRPRLPLLVRGGYLQSHVNGPRVPVYTIQGSHEAYIALTDLPRLQLPALAQVPAYIPESPGLPAYEPPPYSPTAEILSESPERDLNASPTITWSQVARQSLSFDDELTVEPARDDTERQSLPSLDAVEESTVEEHRNVSREVEQSNLAGHDTSDVLGAIDVTIHETDAANDDDEDGVGQTTESEVQDTGSGDAHGEPSTMDHVPPDILTEAIESARSSLHATPQPPEESGLVRADAEVQTQLDAPSLNQLSVSNVDAGEGPSGLVLDITNCPVESTSVAQPQNSADQLRDISQQRNETNPRQHHTSPASKRSQTGSANQIIDHVDDVTRNRPEEADRGEQAGANGNPRRPKRSKSLSAAANGNAEWPSRETRPSSRGKHSKSFSREQRRCYERNPSHDSPTARKISPDRGYNPRSFPVKTRRVPDEDPLMARQVRRSSPENLSDILNLVETVHSTSAGRSKRHKQRRKVSQRGNLLDSRV
ncbi:uncharacterized protein [Diadema antillarum]|uniref:uncharacterized protein n=1 Tax=Diadema antillarum TaxID=105358 RepID=UPI003A86108E